MSTSPIKRLYPVGGRRISKILPALRQEFTIVPETENPVPQALRETVGFNQVGRFVTNIAPILRYHADEDLVVLIDSVGPFSYFVGSLCARLDIPFVVRLRGGMGNALGDRARTSGMSELRQPLYTVRAEWIRDALFGLADGILPVSQFNRMQVFYETIAAIDLEDVRVVNMPLEVDRFDRAPNGSFKTELGIPPEESLILTITSYNVTRKFEGVVRFAPIIARVLENHPNWHFAVVGDGWAFERGQRAIFDNIPASVRERVHIPGFYAPIEEALADADISLHLSYRDAAPMAVLEAQAARNPLLVNDAGGMPNLVDSAVPDALSVVVSEPAELEAPLETLIENPELRAEIGECNREHVERDHSPAKIGRDFRTAIEKLVND